MCLGHGSNASEILSRAFFSWNIRTVPWTDGKESQEPYNKSVRLWEEFHHKFPDAKSNKIPDDLRGIMLLSQIYGRAENL